MRQTLETVFREFDYRKTNKKWENFTGSTFNEYNDWFSRNLKLKVRIRYFVAHHISWRLPYRLMRYFP